MSFYHIHNVYLFIAHSLRFLSISSSLVSSDSRECNTGLPSTLGSINVLYEYTRIHCCTVILMFNFLNVSGSAVSAASTRVQSQGAKVKRFLGTILVFCTGHHSITRFEWQRETLSPPPQRDVCSTRVTARTDRGLDWLKAECYPNWDGKLEAGPWSWCSRILSAGMDTQFLY